MGLYLHFQKTCLWSKSLEHQVFMGLSSEMKLWKCGSNRLSFHGLRASNAMVFRRTSNQYMGNYLHIWSIYFQRASPESWKTRGIELKINAARQYPSNFHNFRPVHSLNRRALVLHWNHSLVLCVYNIQYFFDFVNRFCEKNQKFFFSKTTRFLRWRIFSQEIHLVVLCSAAVFVGRTNACAS